MTKMAPERLKELQRLLVRFYSHRRKDIEEVSLLIQEGIESGEVAADQDLLDVVSRILMGGRRGTYLQVRALALEVLRDRARFSTTSTGEGLALALLFDRKDWLGTETWAYAAKRVGEDWLNAIIQVEQDFAWMKPPIETKRRRRR